MRNHTKRLGEAVIATTLFLPLLGIGTAAAEVKNNPRVTDSCLHTAPLANASDVTALQEAALDLAVATEDLSIVEQEVAETEQRQPVGSVERDYLAEVRQELGTDAVVEASDVLADIEALVRVDSEVTESKLLALDKAINKVEQAEAVVAEEAAKIAEVLADEELPAESRATAVAINASLIKTAQALNVSEKLSAIRAVAVKHAAAKTLSSYVRPVAVKRSLTPVMAAAAKAITADAKAGATSSTESQAAADALLAASVKLEAGDPLRDGAVAIAEILAADAKALAIEAMIPAATEKAVAAAHPLARPAVADTAALANIDKSLAHLAALDTDLSAFSKALSAVSATDTRAAVRDAQLATTAALQLENAASAAKLATARTALVRHVAAESLRSYEVAAIKRTAFESPATAAAKIAADAGAELGELAKAAAAHRDELAAKSGEMNAEKVDQQVTKAVVTGIEAAANAVATAGKTLEAEAANLTKAGAATAENVRTLDQNLADLRAVQQAASKAQAELAVSHEVETKTDVAIRSAAAAELTKAAATLDLAILAAERGVAAVAKNLSAADAASRTEAVAKAAIRLPHATNAAAIGAAKAELGAAVVDAEAAELASIAAGSASTDLRPALAAASKASSDLRVGVAAFDKAAAVAEAGVAAGVRFTESKALASNAEATKTASAELAKARTALSAMKLDTADAAARDAAVASIDRVQATAEARTAAMSKASAVVAKYTYLAAVKEPVREPVKEPVKEPVITEPVVKEPVKEPVVTAPVVEEPAVKEPVAEKSETTSKTVTRSTSADLEAAGHTVVEGETLIIALAELEAGVTDLSVSLDALTEYGTVELVRTATGCELHFTSVKGCIGTDVAEIVIIADGDVTAVDLEIEVVADPATTTTTTTTTTTVPAVGQQPSTLAFTGSWSLVFGGVGVAMMLFGSGLLRISRRQGR